MSRIKKSDRVKMELVLLVMMIAAAKLIRDALSDEEWESFNFYNVFARDGMNPGNTDVRESMNKKVNAVILKHYWVRFFDYRH